MRGQPLRGGKSPYGGAGRVVVCRRPWDCGGRDCACVRSGGCRGRPRLCWGAPCPLWGAGQGGALPLGIIWGPPDPTQPPPPRVLASPLRVDGPGVLRWGLGGAEGDRGRHNRLLLCSLSCFAWPRSGRELNACLPRTKPSEFVSRFARIRLCFLVPNPPLAVQLCCKFPPRSRGTRLEAAEQVAPCRPPSNPAGP